MIEKIIEGFVIFVIGFTIAAVVLSVVALAVYAIGDICQSMGLSF